MDSGLISRIMLISVKLITHVKAGINLRIAQLCSAAVAAAAAVETLVKLDAVQLSTTS